MVDEHVIPQGKHHVSLRYTDKATGVRVTGAIHQVGVAEVCNKTAHACRYVEMLSKQGKPSDCIYSAKGLQYRSSGRPIIPIVRNQKPANTGKKVINAKFLYVLQGWP